MKRRGFIADTCYSFHTDDETIHVKKLSDGKKGVIDAYGIESIKIVTDSGIFEDTDGYIYQRYDQVHDPVIYYVIIRYRDEPYYKDCIRRINFALNIEDKGERARMKHAADRLIDHLANQKL